MIHKGLEPNEYEGNSESDRTVYFKKHLVRINIRIYKDHLFSQLAKLITKFEMNYYKKNYTGNHQQQPLRRRIAHT